MRYYKNFLLFYILLLLISCNKQPDSRHVSIKKEAVGDTTAINHLIDSGFSVKRQNPNLSIPIANQIINSSIHIGYEYGISRGFILKGLSYMDKGDYDSAFKTYNTAIPYARNNKRILATIYNNISNIYWSQGDYNKCTYYLDKALASLDGIKDSTATEVMIIYNNIGIMLVNMNEMEKALFYYKKVEKACRINKSYALLAHVLGNEGTVLIYTHKLKEAHIALEEAIPLSKKYSTTENYVTILNCMGRLYEAENMPEKALDINKEALKLSAYLRPFTQCNLLVTIARLYTKMGQYTEAKYYYSEALEVGIKYNTLMYLEDIYDGLSELYSQTGDYHKAWENEKKFVQIHDSLLADKQTKQINQLDIKYQTAEKDRQLIEKQLMISRQDINLKKKNIWISGISAGALLITILAFGMYRNNRHKQYLQSEKIKVLVKEQEIHLLKALINGEEKERTRIARDLHDGIGSMLLAVKIGLNVLQHKYELGEKKDYDKAYNDMLLLVNETESEVRITAHNMMPDILLRLGLAKALENYLVHRSDSWHPLRIELQQHGQTDGLEEMFQLSIYRIVQQLVKNIVQHAAADYALIQITLQDNAFTLLVEDNGKGFDVEKERKGIGLQNITDRVHSLQGTISIQSQPGSGTLVYIKFDLNYKLTQA